MHLPTPDTRNLETQSSNKSSVMQKHSAKLEDTAKIRHCDRMAPAILHTPHVTRAHPNHTISDFEGVRNSHAHLFGSVAQEGHAFTQARAAIIRPSVPRILQIVFPNGATVVTNFVTV